MEVSSVKMRIEVVTVSADGREHRRQVLAIEREELAMATLGMSLAESKSLLEGVQDSMIAAQAGEDLEQRRACPHCRRRHTAKDSGTAVVKTLFGRFNVPNPRWHCCPCRAEGAKTFRPANAWLEGRTSIEMLYLESKWASLIPFAKVAELLKEVLPVDGSANAETIRTHMQFTAERIERSLGAERQLNEYEGTEDQWEEQPLPDGPITVGIDGGYVRAAHKQGCFEVIAGRSIVAFRRGEKANVPSAKCFGFVQVYDDKPRRRLWELMKSQGMQENQQIVFMSDGGEDVRRVQQYLHPSSEHLLDWFHITMRLTVLQQQTKGLRPERSAEADRAARQLESIKHLLWHGNTPEALERLTSLFLQLDMLRERSAPAAKVANGLADFQTYIKNNEAFIPNFGDRRRQGERISTAFVESTINQVVSRRFVKKQQMQWTLRGAHLLLQTRTKVLNNELEGTFRQWYPQFRAQAA